MCPTCNKDTTSMHEMRKVVYMGHKRFFASNSTWERVKCLIVKLKEECHLVNSIIKTY